ncbi:Putative major facilitator, sugar transporter, major facilitator superfamily [Septoria linicola]|uniref:Major facilitator, sugar transporter, major facilitator superfamily n=1 Tax=Septoria linicola TaxID=215465 RepID=A0A9Q9B0A2_9PEZI|nr:putative major facilitator, sugar transporter, major facilitator superfamily [Septoria linicola]USW58624.1 Putative major facilitator, sugar transporter, major facilitator superfamily [Septoria linicola]
MSIHQSEEELERLVSSTSEEPLLDASTAIPDLHAFIVQHGLERDGTIFERASALLASTAEPTSLPDLTLTELSTLSQSKWRQPPILYLCVAVTALGAMGQGWAQVGINGANLYYPKLFGIGSDSARDTFTVGLINCGIYLSNGLLGSWLVAPLNQRFGRRGAIFIGALLSLLMNLAGSAVYSWQALLLCRLLLGVGLALVSSSLNVFAAECAPAVIRGGLAVSWQAFCAFGIFAGFWTNMLVDSNPEAFGPLRWRVMLLAAAAPTVPLILLIWLVPESPAWYVKHGERFDKAFDSLCRLRNTRLQAAKELFMVQQTRKSSRSNARASLWKLFSELFTIPRVRRATLAAYTAMLAQQLCGINIVAFFSSTIFVQANFSPHAAELASTIFGLCNFLGAFPAVWTMDSLGRRSLMLYTLPPMAIAMAIAALGFSLSDPKTSFYLSTSMIYIFCLLYSPGMGPVPTAYSAEVFPLSHRELGASSAVAVTNTFAAILSLTFPYLLATLDTSGSFLLYAVLNIVAWVLVFLFVPETKRLTLEEMDEVFAVRSRDFVRHHVERHLLRKHGRMSLPKNYSVAPNDQVENFND